MNKLTTVRAIGWIATAALVCAALVTPATTLANTGHQSGDNIAWDDDDFRGSESECEGLDLEDGQVYWHFVQTRVASDIASGQLTATFEEAGTIVSASYKKAGGVLHWGILTGEDTLESFVSDVTSPGQLNLSHICANPSEEETEAPTATPTQAPTATPTQAPTATPTQAPTATPTQAPTATPESEETPTPVATSTPAATPTGEVLAETGTPQVTPPATDTAIAPATGTAGSSWTPLLLIAAGILALTLVLTPATRRTKR